MAVRGQGALEYLLLIAGAVLVSVVILLLTFTTSDQGNVILDQKIVDYANVTSGALSGGPGGNPVCNNNGTCDAGAGETVANCSNDCSICGDGIKSGIEFCDKLGNTGCIAPDTCNAICTACVTPPPAGGGVTCGDNLCHFSEICACDVDCGTCGGGGGGYCGDSTCQPTETCSSCQSDCGTCILPTVTIVTFDNQANENTLLNDNGKVTILRTGNPSASLDVIIESNFGTAQNGSDFQTVVAAVVIPDGAPITIPAGVSSVDVDIVPLQDTIGEGVEVAQITILDPGAAATYALSTVPGESDALVDIIDDDSVAPETLTLAVSDADADEENISDIGTFTITRTTNTSALDVDIAMSGIATNGTDYQTITTPITIPAGRLSVNVDVAPLVDNLDEGDEGVTLTIQPSGAGVYVVNGSSNGTVTIHDNDGGSILPVVTLVATDAVASEPGANTGTFTVTRSIVDASAVDVFVTLTGTAGGGDYTSTSLPVTILANQASAAIVITPVDDSDVEGSETVIATIAASPLAYTIGNPSNDTVTIQDNDFNPPSADLCENYNTGNTNNPGYPSYTSLLEQSWTWRRTLNPATDIDIGFAGPGIDSTSLVTSFNTAACGSTIVVHDLPLATELDGFKLLSKNCNANPIHIYFVAPVVVNGGGAGGDVINIDNVQGLVIDGMNNLKVTTPQGAGPRAIIFIGHQVTGGPAYTSTVKVVLKNIEVDGSYHSATDDGAKWGVFGDGNTDIAFCNMSVHDIWKEHAFYFHTIGGNFEVVKSRMDNVGRTCVQLRDDWQGTPTAKYIISDNDCSNSSEGAGITADDTSGTWWIHGNRIVKAVQGFVSIDSQQQGFFDHRDGHVYFYDNKIKMGEMPMRSAVWGVPAPNQIASLFNIRDGGSSFYMQNNVFVTVPGATTNILQKQYVNAAGHYPHNIIESNNNTYGYGLSSHTGTTNDRITRWDDAGGSCFLSIAAWQSTTSTCGETTAYDTTGTFVWKNYPANNPAYTALLNLFNGMP